MEFKLIDSEVVNGFARGFVQFIPNPSIKFQIGTLNDTKRNSYTQWVAYKDGEEIDCDDDFANEACRFFESQLPLKE